MGNDHRPRWCEIVRGHCPLRMTGKEGGGRVNVSEIEGDKQDGFSGSGVIFGGSAGVAAQRVVRGLRRGDIPGRKRGLQTVREKRKTENVKRKTVNSDLSSRQCRQTPSHHRVIKSLRIRFARYRYGFKFRFIE